MAKTWRFVTAGALLALLAAAAPSLSLQGGQAPAPAPAPADVPTYATEGRSVWLDQNWTAAQRDQYHHISQGTATLPIPATWFLALEQPEASLRGRGLFSDPAYLDRFGFIPGQRSADNPAGLPVGLAISSGVGPSTGVAFEQVGFTCAACHTGRISYGGTEMLIDGGPAMIELGKFRKALADALVMTAGSPTRFERFADRVLGPRHSLRSGIALHRQVTAAVATAVIQKMRTPTPAGSVEEGFGRLDALNRIGNEVFASQMKQKANYAALSAPVAYPHIWDTAWFDWVQYNSSIQQPMVRNAGEAMGVRALVNFTAGLTPRFTSTVPIDRLHDIESRLAGQVQPTDGKRFTGLRSPMWPASILPAIDRTLAARGAVLYRQQCASCHLPAPDDAAFWTSDAWLAPNQHGQRYLRLPLSTIDEIGTDRAQADDMKARRVRVPLAYGLSIQPSSRDGTDGLYPYGPALGDVVEKVVDRWYDSRTPATSPADRARMNGYRPNGIRDGLPGPGGDTRPVYKARPLNGIWATAPFLHNGSVPTLYDLLSPWAERPKSFWLGNRAFDPVKVGYRTDRVKGGFLLIAVDAGGRMVRGNGNGGHLFESPTGSQPRRPGTIGPYLSPEDRRALVEYLKTL